MRKLGIITVALACSVFTTAGPSMASPEDTFNFCSYTGGDMAIKSGYSEDPVAGVTTTSSVFIPRSGGWFGIYFSNDGPGEITFTVPAFSTIKGGPIPQATNTLVSTTPRGEVVFYDWYFGGTWPEGVDFIGCVYLYPGTGTVHLDLSFTRGAVTYSERVNVHYR